MRLTGIDALLPSIYVSLTFLFGCTNDGDCKCRCGVEQTLLKQYSVPDDASEIVHCSRMCHGVIESMTQQQCVTNDCRTEFAQPEDDGDAGPMSSYCNSSWNTESRRYPEASDKYELKQFQIFGRHGARWNKLSADPKLPVPEMTCPKDDLPEMSFYEGPNARCYLKLTPEGSEMWQSNGDFYKALFEKVHDSGLSLEKQMYARSRPNERCHDSLLAFLGSVVTPDELQSFEDGTLPLVWNVETYGTDDPMFGVVCNKDEYVKSILQWGLDIMKNYDEQCSFKQGFHLEQNFAREGLHEELIWTPKEGHDLVEEFLGTSCPTVPATQKLWPVGLGKDEKDKCSELPASYFYYYSNLYYHSAFNGYRPSLQYAFGPLYQEILDNMQNFISGESQRSTYVYMGSDSGPVGPIIGGLRLAPLYYRNVWPGFASSVDIELYQKDGEYFVRFLYQDEIMKMGDFDFNGISLPAQTDDYVAWDAVESRLKALIPADTACQTSFKDKSNLEGQTFANNQVGATGEEQTFVKNKQENAEAYAAQCVTDLTTWLQQTAQSCDAACQNIFTEGEDSIISIVCANAFSFSESWMLVLPKYLQRIPEPEDCDYGSLFTQYDSLVGSQAEDTSGGVPWWAWLLIILAVVGIIVAVTVVLIKKFKGKGKPKKTKEKVTQPEKTEEEVTQPEKTKESFNLD